MSQDVKTVTVRYFAAYREALGCAEESIRTRADTLKTLFAELSQRHPRLEHYAAARLAVNDEMARWDTVLADGDTVLLFPPVAGG